MTKKLHTPSRPSPLKHCVLVGTPTKTIIKTQQPNTTTDMPSNKELRKKLYGEFPVMSSNIYLKVALANVVTQLQKTLKAEQAQKNTELAALSTNNTTSDQKLSGEGSLHCNEELLDDWF